MIHLNDPPKRTRLDIQIILERRQGYTITCLRPVPHLR